ncbi:terminase small subunit [Klebsiella aerogenes]|uniref:terminase small subunit n=1 Tax=Klebsiella aerogenes TaxID=548 RepID=UPI001F1872F3|nr:terminase small subunit [Klebsiella aerogenes]
MKLNKKDLADMFGVDVRTITVWQSQGLPVDSGGGKGVEVFYESAAAIKWFCERECDLENEKLRREVEELRVASESDLQPGTIDYERYRLTKEQADAQELKNMKDKCLVVDTAFCTFALSRLANDIASVLDGIPLAMQRRYPDMDKPQLDYLKTQVAKAMNLAVRTSEKIPEMLDEYIDSTNK